MKKIVGKTNWNFLNFLKVQAKMTSPKVVKWKCDHFHLSNLKQSTLLWSGDGCVLKNSGFSFFVFKCVTVEHPTLRACDPSGYWPLVWLLMRPWVCLQKYFEVPSINSLGKRLRTLGTSLGNRFTTSHPQLLNKLSHSAPRFSNALSISPN